MASPGGKPKMTLSRSLSGHINAIGAVDSSSKRDTASVDALVSPRIGSRVATTAAVFGGTTVEKGTTAASQPPPPIQQFETFKVRAALEQTALTKQAIDELIPALTGLGIETESDLKVALIFIFIVLYYF